MLDLVCKQVHFFSEEDEVSFISWLKKIEAIQDIKGFGDEIRLNLSQQEINDDSLRELIAIFYRYDIEPTQLRQFRNQSNEYWFYNNREAFWWNDVFGTKK